MLVAASIAARRSRLRHGGFTIIEILFVIALLAVLSSLAAPSFRGFVASQRIRAASADLSAALMLARAEAVKRNTSVVVSPQTGGWINGWTIASGSTNVAQHEALADLAIAGPAGSITYTANGRVSAAVSRFAISSTLSAGTAARCIRVDLTGMTAAYSGTGCP